VEAVGNPVNERNLGGTQKPHYGNFLMVNFTRTFRNFVGTFRTFFRTSLELPELSGTSLELPEPSETSVET
jgi:hypothetical protein